MNNNSSKDMNINMNIDKALISKALSNQAETNNQFSKALSIINVADLDCHCYERNEDSKGSVYQSKNIDATLQLNSKMSNLIAPNGSKMSVRFPHVNEQNLGFSIVPDQNVIVCNLSKKSLFMPVKKEEEPIVNSKAISCQVNERTKAMSYISFGCTGPNTL